MPYIYVDKATVFKYYRPTDYFLADFLAATAAATFFSAEIRLIRNDGGKIQRLRGLVATINTLQTALLQHAKRKT